MEINQIRHYTLEVDHHELYLILAGLQHLRDNFPSKQKDAEKMYLEIYNAMYKERQ